MKPKKVISCASRGREVPGTGGGWKKAKHRQMLELGSSQYSNCITSIQKDYMILLDYGTVKF